MKMKLTAKQAEQITNDMRYLMHGYLTKQAENLITDLVEPAIKEACEQGKPSCIVHCCPHQEDCMEYVKVILEENGYTVKFPQKRVIGIAWR